MQELWAILTKHVYFLSYVFGLKFFDLFKCFFKAAGLAFIIYLFNAFNFHLDKERYSIVFFSKSNGLLSSVLLLPTNFNRCIYIVAWIITTLRIGFTLILLTSEELLKRINFILLHVQVEKKLSIVFNILTLVILFFLSVHLSLCLIALIITDCLNIILTTFRAVFCPACTTSTVGSLR